MFQRPAFILIAIFSTVFCTLSVALEPSTSPDLICHTADESECYPRLFEATDEFQVVRDGQEIPSGLHVRLNIQTGLKEAKLYDGNDDDLGSTVEVHPDAPSEPEDRVPAHEIDAPPTDYSPEAPKVPAELYQAILNSGDRTIKRPVDGDADAKAFKAAVADITSPDAQHENIDTLDALNVLEDLAHDIYWGLTLAQSSSAIHSLAALISHEDEMLASAAALVLGNTVSNNPKALNLTLAAEPDLPTTVQKLLFKPCASPSPPARGQAKTRCPEPETHPLPPRQYTRLLRLLSGLLSSQKASTTGANADGLHGLLISDNISKLISHFAARNMLASLPQGASPSDPSSDPWNRARQAIADFVLDRIADSESIKPLATLPWRIWDARQGYDDGKAAAIIGSAGFGGGEPPPDWSVRSAAAAAMKVAKAAKEGREEEWVEAFAGNDFMKGVWVRLVTDAEKSENGGRIVKSKEPVKLRGKVLEGLEQACSAFESALGQWEFGKKGVEGTEGTSSDVEVHVQEALAQVRARLREAGCDGCSCSPNEKKAPVKDEL